MRCEAGEGHRTRSRKLLYILSQSLTSLSCLSGTAAGDCCSSTSILNNRRAGYQGNLHFLQTFVALFVLQPVLLCGFSVKHGSVLEKQVKKTPIFILIEGFC